MASPEGVSGLFAQLDASQAELAADEPDWLDTSEVCAALLAKVAGQNPDFSDHMHACL